MEQPNIVIAPLLAMAGWGLRSFGMKSFGIREPNGEIARIHWSDVRQDFYSYSLNERWTTAQEAFDAYVNYYAKNRLATGTKNP